MTGSRVAVFDLDHTLTRYDTFIFYLLGFLVRHPWRLLRCLHLPMLVLFFYSGKLSNSRLKQSFLYAVLGGVQRTALNAWTKRFLHWLVSNGMYREALSVLELHRQAGDILVLLTASLDCYVLELGRLLNFNEVICTRVEWKQDRLSGRLASPNIRGEEKVRCLLDMKARYNGAHFIAYADHQSDLALLRLVDTGILINGQRKAQKIANENGLSSHDWKE